MTPIEKECRSISTRIGGTLLFFTLLMLLRELAMAYVPLLTASFSAQAALVAEELIGAALYAFAFTLPVLFFKLLSRKCVLSSIHFRLEFTGEGVKCAFFGVAVTLALAYVNSKMLDVFRYSEFSDQYIWQNDVGTNVQVVLLFLTVAVVPAFVEELLFRGVILQNLLPYGKTVAIFGSAFLFGMMHQNAEQLLYATGAGLVFGWIYVHTRSIWPCVLAHFLNNFHAVVQIVIAERLPVIRAQSALYLMEGVLLLLGILSAISLFRAERVRKENVQEQAVQALSLRRRARLFFSVPMTFFVVWCVANMLVLILMALSFV